VAQVKVMSKIIDCISYNGEEEIWEIRYNILKDFIDEFRVIEFDKTFSGKPKEKKFNQNWDKVKHYFITEDIWGKYWEEAKKSPNTNYGEGAKHWIREWCMKESLKDCLTDLDDEDIIYLGDVDELYEWNELMISGGFNNKAVFKLKLRVYTYWLNNRSSEEFWGTIASKYKNIKGKCLNELRTDRNYKTPNEHGYHFTSMGGYDKVKEKLTDSYTEETYASKQVLNNLENNIKENRDFLGRNFIYKIDESELPKWLLENKERYKHLFKPVDK